MLSSRNGQSKESVCCWCSQGSNGEQQSFHARAVQSWCDTCVRTDADDENAMVVDPQNFASLMDASLDAMVRPKRFRICSVQKLARAKPADLLGLRLGPQGKLDQIGKPQQPLEPDRQQSLKTELSSFEQAVKPPSI